MEEENRTLFSSIGQIMRTLEGKRLADVFRFVSFLPMERFGQHAHHRLELNYVKKGSCIIRLENESVSFRENELMIICSDVPHSFQAGSEGCTLMQLEFLPEVFGHFEDYLDVGCSLTPLSIFSSANRLIKIVNNVRIMRAIQRIVTEMNTRNKYYEHLVVMYYAELLILIYRHMDETYFPLSSNNTMRKAINYIREHYKDDISIGDVAEEACIGERYLRKIFSQHLNLSPVDYLNQIRINKAIELLRITELSVKEVCFECGFRSPQYFSRIFKQLVGVSPSDLLK